MSSSTRTADSSVAISTSNHAAIEFIDSDGLGELEFSAADRKLVDELIAEIATGDSALRTANRLCSLMSRSLPPLNADEERLLFRRMNYNRFQAEALRSSLSARKPSRRKQAQLRILLDEADQIRRRIVESNLRLVMSIARRFVGPHHEIQELVSDGLLILLGAIQKFDYARGFRFSTYATHSIQRYYYRSTQKTHKYHQRYVLTPGEVMAEVAGVAEDEVEFEKDAAAIYRQLMESAEGRLNERETSILHRRFGTGGFGMTQTLREVASDLGISKERVRQVQIAALVKLQEVAAELNLMPTAG